MYHWFMAYSDPPLAWIPGNTWPSLFLGQLRPLLVACLRPAHIDAQGTTWRFPEMRVQWNNCLRTYCNKSFRGWVAGFNPFCQLIEIKTLSWKSSHGFLFPLHGYQYTKYGSSAAISQKKNYVPRKFYADDKHGAAPGRSGSLCSHQGLRQQIQPETSRSHRRLSDLGGCPWLVLACLGLSVLPCFGRPHQTQTFGTWKFFSSPRLLCNLIPRQNELSSPAMVEYLAYGL